MEKNKNQMGAEEKSMWRNGSTGIAVLLLILLALIPSFVTLILGQ